MPYIAQTRDLSKQYLGYARNLLDFRPIASTTYTPGLICQLVAMDSQIYPDAATVAPTGTAAAQQLIQGVVAEIWPGFNGAGLATTYVSPTNVTTTERGTVGVTLVTQGYHPQVFVDQSGTGAVTLTNGIPVIASRATAGYGQGATTPVSGAGTVGVAMLPASGIGSSLTAAALAQATQTDTVATPASGDQLNLTIQSPYNTTSPGVVQTITYSLVLNATTAASATTAAAAMVAYLNSQSSYSQYFTATNAAGVITNTVNTQANPFLVTTGSGTYVQNQWYVSISGVVANTLTVAASVTGSGGTTFSVTSGSTFSGGTGYKGTIPMLVTAD